MDNQTNQDPIAFFHQRVRGVVTEWITSHQFTSQTPNKLEFCFRLLQEVYKDKDFVVNKTGYQTKVDELFNALLKVTQTDTSAIEHYIKNEPGLGTWPFQD